MRCGLRMSVVSARVSGEHNRTLEHATNEDESQTQQPAALFDAQADNIIEMDLFACV
jgi:hypothetical protein